MRNKRMQGLLQNDYVYTVGVKIAVALIGVLSSSIAKRFFGPAIEGEVGYIDSILTIVAVVANLGLYQPYPYYKRQGEENLLDRFLNLFALQFILYAVVGVGIAAVSDNFALRAVCIIVPLQVFANQLSFLIMVEDVKYKNRTFFIARIINTLFLVAASIFLQPAVWISLLMIVIGDVLTIGFTLHRFGRFGNPFRADLRFLAKILPFGIVAMLTTLLLTLNYKVDELMLKWMGIADTQRGFYRTGMSLATYGWLIPDAFREVLFSRTAKDDAIGDMKWSLKTNFYITMAIIIGIAVFGKPVIGLLFGQAYLPSYPVTLILLIGILSMSYFKLIGTLLLAQGKKAMYMGTLAASALVNVAANLYTIPRWGIEGAAWASVLSYSVAGMVFLVYFCRTHQVRMKELFFFSREELGQVKARLRRK